MRHTTKAQLEEARALFYSWRLMDAYNVLRRFYARLPFAPDDLHAEYIGMFARVLAELGKTRELQFHMSELERLHRKLKSPAIAFQLAVVYSYIPEPRHREAKELLEAVVRDPAAKEYQIKAKLMLADWYDRLEENISACRAIIDSIETPKDRDLRNLVLIWRAKVLRDEQKFAAADACLHELLASLSLPEDWYSIASAKVILARSLIRQKRYEDSARLVLELRAAFSGKNFRSIEFQIADLERDLRKTPGLGTLVFRPGEEWSLLKYSRRSIKIKGNTQADRVLLELLTQQFVEGRGLDRYIAAIRRQLKKIGLPPEAILREGKRYRLVPLVEIQENR